MTITQLVYNIQQKLRLSLPSILTRSVSQNHHRARKLQYTTPCIITHLVRPYIIKRHIVSTSAPRSDRRQQRITKILRRRAPSGDPGRLHFLRRLSGDGGGWGGVRVGGKEGGRGRSLCSMHALIFYKGRKINSTIFTSKNESAGTWRMFAQQSSSVYSNLLSASRFREIEILQANILHHIL